MMGLFDIRRTAGKELPIPESLPGQPLAIDHAHGCRSEDRSAYVVRPVPGRMRSTRRHRLVELILPLVLRQFLAFPGLCCFVDRQDNFHTLAAFSSVNAGLTAGGNGCHKIFQLHLMTDERDRFRV